MAARLKYCIGAMAFTMIHPHPHAESLPADPLERERLIAFLAAGLQTPAAVTGGGTS